MQIKVALIGYFHRILTHSTMSLFTHMELTYEHRHLKFMKKWSKRRNYSYFFTVFFFAKRKLCEGKQKALPLQRTRMHYSSAVKCTPAQ